MPTDGNIGRQVNHASGVIIAQWDSVVKRLFRDIEIEQRALAKMKEPMAVTYCCSKIAPGGVINFSGLHIIDAPYAGFLLQKFCRMK